MIGFPLLLIPFAIYNMVAFLTPMDLTTRPYTVALKSGLSWGPTVSDVFLTFALLMLMCEFIKSARQGKSFVEHFLALLLAGGAAAEFVMVREGGNSTFFLLVVICFIDLFAGFAASIRRVRHAVVVEPEPVILPQVPRAEQVRTETVRVEPVRGEQVRVEPVHADPFGRVEPVHSDPFGKVEPAGGVVRIDTAASPVQKAGP